MRPGSITARLRPHLAAAVPGLLAVGLMLVWAAHNGGYDAETWYWGALVALALLAATVVALGPRLVVSASRLRVVALFAAYVGWCYLSMAWAPSPGAALAGANQALLYLLMFSLMLLLPWTPEAALAVVSVFVVGLGAIGVVLLFRLASDDHVAGLVVQGRLAAPTGYVNSTAALFTMGALPAVALAVRRELPGPLRGLMLALACADLQLAVIVQSRGWLFTLPLVAVAAIIIARERLRVLLAAVLPLAGALVPLTRLLAVYQSSGGAVLGRTAGRAGQAALLICVAVFVVGTLAAWADTLHPTRPLSRHRRRAVGYAITVLAVLAFAGAGTYATHGHPFSFISRQWNGFSHAQKSFSAQSHFSDVGTARYDFWRVALEAWRTHPLVGLGEDNFADYYLTHRRIGYEPSWTHSIELRLLAQTGLVGFGLFVAFMIGALRFAVRARRHATSLAAGIAGAALLPLAPWLIHGSVDWFWELPALAGPALGFLGLSGGLDPEAAAAASAWNVRRQERRRVPRLLGIAGASVALAAGVVVLGLPYLSVRETSLASDVRATDPAAALADLSRAADLNPLSPSPGSLAGTIALQNGEYAVAEARFRQSISNEPGAWYAWLGSGLAASALHEPAVARRDYERAYAINSRQPAVGQALARVNSRNPMTSAQAFKLFLIAQ